MADNELDESGRDYEQIAFDRMMDGAEQARKQRQGALAVGCLVPIVGAILLAIFAIASR